MRHRNPSFSVGVIAAVHSLLVLSCSQSSTHPPDRFARPPVPPDDAGVEDASLAEDASVCTPPSHLLIEVLGSESELRLGWSGFGHIIKLNDGVQTAVELFDCSEDCQRCRFTGPVPVPGGSINHKRCLGATHVECDSDEDCSGEGAGQCRYFVGPATQIAFTESIVLCALVHFEALPNPIPNGSRDDASAIQGFVDLETGASTLNSMNVRLFTNGCGSCLNDDVVGDGNFDGTCSIKGFLGEPIGRDGEPCDTQATSDGKPVSYECAAPLLDASSGVPTQIGPLTTGKFERTLTVDSPPCDAEDGSYCWCGECTLGPKTPCSRDSECALGTCGPALGTKPDACEIGMDPEATVPGTCEIDDPERNTGTCPAYLRFGDLALPATTSCFGDGGQLGQSISALGKKGAFNEEGVSLSTIAGIACLPRSSNEGIANALGLAGPGLFEFPIRTTILRGGDAP